MVVVLPSPAGVGVIAGDQDQLAVRPVLETLDVVHRDLGLVVAVGLEVFHRDAEPLARHVGDQALGRGLGDFNV